MKVRDALPREWIDKLEDGGELGAGLDLATTESGTSNPSSLTVFQKRNRMKIARLLIAFKTSDPMVTRRMLECVLDDIAAAGRRLRRLCIDASNEKFFAADLRRDYSGRAPIELVVANQKLKYRGEELDAKTLLGNLYANDLEDGLILLPGGDWIRDDHRLVQREKGMFVTPTGKDGQHGDTFDSSKLANWALESGGGPAKAEAASVGTLGTQGGLRPGIRNPYARRFERRTSLHA